MLRLSKTPLQHWALNAMPALPCRAPEAVTPLLCPTHFCPHSCFQGICYGSRNCLTTQFFLFPGKTFILLCCALKVNMNEAVKKGSFRLGCREHGMLGWVMEKDRSQPWGRKSEFESISGMWPWVYLWWFLKLGSTIFQIKEAEWDLFSVKYLCVGVSSQTVPYVK